MRNEEILEVLEKTKVGDLSKEQMLDIIAKSFEYCNDGGVTNLIIAYEELNELQQSITKEIRNKGNRLNVIEEVVDVIDGILFINHKYDFGFDMDDTYSRIEEDSLFVVLRHLTKLQNEILNALIDNDVTSLYESCLEVLHSLENIKEYFNISKEEIEKIRISKLRRLKERMKENKLV